MQDMRKGLRVRVAKRATQKVDDIYPVLIVTAVWGFLLGRWWAGVDEQTKKPPPPKDNGIWW